MLPLPRIDVVVWGFRGGEVAGRVPSCVLQLAANEKNVVGKSEVGEVRVVVVFGKSDSVVVHLPLSCSRFHDVLQE